MGELASYSLSDFILFSEWAYYRQFDAYNRDIWPLQLLALALPVLIMHALVRGYSDAASGYGRGRLWPGRTIAFILVVSWLWVAFAFLHQRFSQIHVAANGYAFGFVIQAALLVYFGIIRDRFSHMTDRPLSFAFGWVFMLAGFIAYPFVAMLSGRHWLQFEMFGLTPDATVLASLGIFMVLKTSPLLYLLPVTWLVISYTTQAVM